MAVMVILSFSVLAITGLTSSTFLKSICSAHKKNREMIFPIIIIEDNCGRLWLNKSKSSLANLLSNLGDPSYIQKTEEIPGMKEI